MRPAKVLAALLTLFFASLSLSACSDGDGTPTPTATIQPTATAQPSAPAASSPTPEPTPSATPAGNGLFVYVAPDDPSGPLTLAVFDMAAGRERAVETFVNERPNHAAVWRDGLVLAFSHRIELTDFDLVNRRIVFQAPPAAASGVADIAVSPDGLRLALTIEPAACSRPECTFYASQLYVLDLPSGQEVLKLDWPDPGTQGFDGALWQVQWRDDGSGVWVAGATHSERSGTKATVTLDGSVRIEPLRGFASIAPNGRIAAHGPDSLGCMFISGHSLSIVDLDSEVALFAIEDGSLAFTPWEWSPAGDESVFAVRAYPQGTTPGDCDWVQAQPEWRIARLDGRPTRTVTVPELIQLRSEWYEDRFVTAGCEREENPMLGRYGDPAAQCDPSLPPGAIRVNGVDVGRTGRVAIVGFVE